jgi:hypothetical protein
MTAPAPPAPTPPAANPPAPKAADHGMRWIYWAIVVVLVVLAVVGLITYRTAKTNQDAQNKAQTLSQSLAAAGLYVPKQDVIVNSLGTDGGAVCENPANALGKATLLDNLTNGASFVGRRPVIVDNRVLLGELLILQTYCPDKLQPYQDKINQLKTADVVNPR